MIENFLERPRSIGEFVADGVRMVGVASIIAAAIWWQPVDVAMFALVLLGLVVPRFLGVRSSFDVAFGLALLVAAWSSLLDLYTTVAGWDLVVHFVANGLLAGTAYVLFARFALAAPGDAPAPVQLSGATVALLTTAFGLALGAVWEMAEWLGNTYIDETIFVGYDDSIGDMAVGALGSVIVGVAMPFFSAANRGDRARGGRTRIRDGR